MLLGRLDNCCRRHLFPVVLFAGLMTLKYTAIFTYPVFNSLEGDEYDYVGKARSFWQYGAFAGIQDVSRERFRYSDFRPPGYSILIAPCLMFGDSIQQIHWSVRVLQSGLDILLTLSLFALIWQFSTSQVFRCLGACVLGVQPWTSAWVVQAITETAVTFLTILGIAVLCRVTSTARRAGAWTLVGSLLLTATFTMRPEMVVMVPPVIALSLLLSGLGWRRILWHGVLASLPFGLCILALITYRAQVAGEVRVFGRFQCPAPGLRLWADTWTASEMVKCNVIWDTQGGRRSTQQLPENVFDNDMERARVAAIFNRIHQAGRMTADDDAEFAALAKERMSRHPVRYVWVRLYNTVALWLNLMTSSPYLSCLAEMPRVVSKMAVGGLFALRLLTLSLAATGALRLWCRRSLRFRWIERFLLVGLCFVVLRTLFFGLYMGAIENRYMTPAWPFVLSLALYGLAGVRVRDWAVDSDTTRECGGYGNAHNVQRCVS